ncbi:hypothetical protein [Bacillus altitudinis]|uniref:hypothetical protein n=1 Tax=Bacillus altitudinis TaxID=293387 RepID=UPI003D00A6D7
MLANFEKARQAKSRLQFWKKEFDKIEEKRKRNSDNLTRQEWWEREYYETPYLTFARDSYLEERFFDHFHNIVRLTAEGQIAPREDFAEPSGLIAPLFSHLKLEFSARGKGLPKVRDPIRDQLGKYFVNGTPTGVRLFRDLPETIGNVIVKFGKKNHLENMINKGAVRLTPADFYNNGDLIEAMQDLETERWFHDPKFGHIISGKSIINYQGVDRQIEDGFLKYSISCPNYLLWSACKDIDRRLPDDFQADAAVIIKEPNKFINLISNKTREIWPRAKIYNGDVKYYDPCSYVDAKRRPATIKHFKFLYQREWRFCAFPSVDDMPNEPMIVELGSLGDIAELVTL